MFSTAKPITKAPTSAKKAAKAEHDIAGIQDIALLKALIASATAMCANLEADVKTQGFDIFMESKGGTRPTSFSGLDGKATCSVEMRKRSSASGLTEYEAEVLVDAGFEPFKQVAVTELFAINPTHAADQALLAKVEKTLSKLGLPADFIVKQEEVSKLTVTDEMLDVAFRKSAPDAVLQIMTTMALKPKLTEAYDMNNLIADALAVMQPAKKAKQLPKAKAKAKKA